MEVVSVAQPTAVGRLNSTNTCSVCGYLARDKTNLRKHMYTHTGEKPYVCHHCSYKTTQNSNLRTHMRRHHPQVPPPAEGPYKKYSVLGFPIRDQIKKCLPITPFSPQCSTGSFITVGKIVNPFKNPLPFSPNATHSTSQFFYSPERVHTIPASPSLSPCSSVGMLSPERSHIAITNEDAQLEVSVAEKQSLLSDTSSTHSPKICTTSTQFNESSSISKATDITSKDNEISE